MKTTDRKHVVPQARTTPTTAPPTPAEVAAVQRAAPAPAPRDVSAAQRIIASGAPAGSAHGARSSSMLAVRLLASAEAPTKADATVLRVQLRDPATGEPPTVDQLADRMLSVLRRGVPPVEGGTLAALATAPKEGYFALTYADATGTLSLKHVATGSDRAVDVKLADVVAAVGPGEQLMGGLHSHPGQDVAEPSTHDHGASATAHAHAARHDVAGFTDYVLAEGTKLGPSVAEVPRGAAAEEAEAEAEAVQYRARSEKGLIRAIARKYGVSERDLSKEIHEVKGSGGRAAYDGVGKSRGGGNDDLTKDQIEDLAQGLRGDGGMMVNGHWIPDWKL